ncbi:MAG: hypothetical protein AAF616_00170 [Bacteroidota bacterium]
MNKNLGTFLATLLIFSFATAQDFDASELEAFNSERLQINKRGMLVLGGWALANIIASTILASRTSGVNKHFHQMNGYWNSINLIIGGFGYYSAITGGPGSLALSGSLDEQHSIEKILLFNTGLDLAYVTAGLYLNERGMRRTNDRLMGFGRSLMLQGGFLFAFDLTLYLIHSKHGAALSGIVDQLAISENGIGLIWKF